MVAGRGITAGSVHATIELRLLLIEWFDDTVRTFSLITITVYVDDTSLESAGSSRTVVDTVVGAVKHFTTALFNIGMDVSPTKNVIMASHTDIATRILSQFPGLNLSIVKCRKILK